MEFVASYLLLGGLYLFFKKFGPTKKQLFDGIIENHETGRINTYPDAGRSPTVIPGTEGSCVKHDGNPTGGVYVRY